MAAAFPTAFEHRIRDYPAVLLLPSLFALPATPLSEIAAAEIESWWTGKDSNLRSPQGAADLQSAGFSHSPTRPRNLVTQSACRFCQAVLSSGAGYAKTQNGLVSKDTSPFMLPCRDSLRLTPLPKIWWSWRRELNPRPSDYKSDALPAELRQRCSNRTRIAD